jgi:hypothetical protein
MNVSSVKNLNGETFSAVQDATLTDVVQSNSAQWGQGGNDLVHKSDFTFVTDQFGTYLHKVSGKYIDYATRAGQAELDSNGHTITAQYFTTANANTLSSMLSGAIDYVSANAGDEFPASADEAIQYVQTNSANIDDTITNVSTNSGAWGGEALPISAGPGIKVNLVDNTLVFSNDETVLYNNLTGRPDSPGQSIILSESPLNFDKVAIYLNGSTPTGTINVANGYEEVPLEQISSSNTLQFMKAFCGTLGNQDATFEMGCGYSGTSGLTWTKWYGYAKSVLTNEAAFDNPTHLNIWKVVGINRIAGGD